MPAPSRLRSSRDLPGPSCPRPLPAKAQLARSALIGPIGSTPRAEPDLVGQAPHARLDLVYVVRDGVRGSAIEPFVVGHEPGKVDREELQKDLPRARSQEEHVRFGADGSSVASGGE